MFKKRNEDMLIHKFLAPGTGAVVIDNKKIKIIEEPESIKKATIINGSGALFNIFKGNLTTVQKKLNPGEICEINVVDLDSKNNKLFFALEEDLENASEYLQKELDDCEHFSFLISHHINDEGKNAYSVHELV